MSKHRYTVITPAFNEAGLLPRVIESMARQQIPPVSWIIVDDRSTDDTWFVLEAAAREYSFIKPIRIAGDSVRKVGANVVRVFNRGLAELEQPTEFFVKMDADVILPPHYFAFLMEKFENEPSMGMASGKTYTRLKKQWVLERCPNFHVVGPCKMYRRSCLEDIGGLIPILGWDILDGASARLKGWTTRSFRELPIYHLRLMGSAKGILKGRLRTGKVMYSIRAHPLFVLGKSIFRAFERPYLSGFLIPFGYLISFITKPDRLEDMVLANFLRREQISRLLGKTRAQEEVRSRRLGP